MSGIKQVLYAPNVHQGGGKTLLLPLLDELKTSEDILFILDERLQLPDKLVLSGKLLRVKATLAARIMFEWRLRYAVSGEAKWLCFGNLPPLLAHDGDQVVFVQNRYLIEDVTLKQFPFLVQFRIKIERWWLRSRQRYAKRFVVQTPTMQHLLKNALGRESEILPFALLPSFPKNSKKSENKELYDFLYVASGEPHKNHRNLILAWIELANKNEFPNLCLTLDKQLFPGLCSWISSMVQIHNLHVTLFDKNSLKSIQHLYMQTRALIFPSSFESFGLPLLEAVSAGLPILATDADYIQDVVHPTAVFDHCSPKSIAQGVLDFSYKPASRAIDLLNAKSFLSAVFNENIM